MADFKKVALSIGIMILLPLFIGLFFDAIYQEPKYELFCNEEFNRAVPVREKAAPDACLNQEQLLECDSRGVLSSGKQLFDCKVKAAPAGNCVDAYQSLEAQACGRSRGNAQFRTDESCCQVFESCNYCNRDYQDAVAKYNRNLFFILAPIGLLVIIAGIYLAIDYLAVGFMFAGLITLFYATVRYFSEMSKLLRAIVILAELLIIIWLGLKKIGRGKEAAGALAGRAKVKNSGRLKKR